MEKKSSKLLEHRNRQKARKPEFLRTDGHKRMKLQRKWRRPAGLHNKMRLNKRGYRRSVTVGWKSPGAVYGMSRNGLMITVVHNLNELSRVEPSKTGVFIASTVGAKKRFELLKEAISKKITVFNHKDPQKFVDIVTERIAKKKALAVQDKSEKKPEGKIEKTLDTIADDEGKKDAEKKEKDKILTKKV